MSRQPLRNWEAELHDGHEAKLRWLREHRCHVTVMSMQEGEPLLRLDIAHDSLVQIASIKGRDVGVMLNSAFAVAEHWLVRRFGAQALSAPD